MDLGTNFTLTPTFIPSYASNQAVKWTSSDTSIASVSAAGVVAGKKAGIKIPPYAKVLNYNLLILSEKTWYKKICALLTTIVGKRFGNVRPSTLQSLDRGEKTEIDIFNGYIIEMGKKTGVPTPVNQQIYDAIKAIENGEMKSSMENLDKIVL